MRRFIYSWWPPVFFFFKQKTAYEMLSGDWRSDVCSSDLDLSNSNEPILVLTANARLLRHSTEPVTPELQYFITLVAHSDINGDLRKLFSSVTDTGHLDVIPRLELIDAVDADGDGRGDLLFRRISDA